MTEHLVYSLTLECGTLHERGQITALADGIAEMFEARLDVLDVISPTVIIPPEVMEFRPQESRSQPGRLGSLALYVNVVRIQPGRKVRLETQRVHGSVGFVEGGKVVAAVAVILQKEHVIEGTSVARIRIPWRGSGWGQSAIVKATTKLATGALVEAEGRILLEQPEETGGIIKDVKYRNLRNEKCSDLVDGVIYINSNHYLNRLVFGSEMDYKDRLGNDHTAQFRFASLVLEQAVFRLAEDSYIRNQLPLNDRAPVTSLREFIDQKTHQFAPKIVRAFMKK